MRLPSWGSTSSHRRNVILFTSYWVLIKKKRSHTKIPPIFKRANIIFTLSLCLKTCFPSIYLVSYNCLNDFVFGMPLTTRLVFMLLVSVQQSNADTTGHVKLLLLVMSEALYDAEHPLPSYPCSILCCH